MEYRARAFIGFRAKSLVNMLCQDYQPTGNKYLICTEMKFVSKASSEKRAVGFKNLSHLTHSWRISHCHRGVIETKTFKLSQKRNAKVENENKSVYYASFFAEWMYNIFRWS